MEILMTTDSQDLCLMSHPKDCAFYSIVSPSLHWQLWFIFVSVIDNHRAIRRLTLQQPQLRPSQPLLRPPWAPHRPLWTVSN